MALHHPVPKFIAILFMGVCSSIGLAGFDGTVRIELNEPAIAQSLDAEQLYQQGRQQFSQQAYEAALNSLQSAVNLAIAANDQALAAEALYELGRTYYAIGRYASAIDQHQLSLDLWDQLETRYTGTDNATNLRSIQFNRALVLTEIGRSLQALGEYGQAQSRYDQALAIHTDLGSQRERAIVLNEIANLLRSQAQYEDALRVHEQALSVIAGVDPQGESRVLNNIGVTYYSLGDYAQALQTYEQALSISGIDRISTIATLINIASIHIVQDDLTAAEQRYQEVLDLRRQGPTASINPVQEAVLANNIGGFYAAQQRYDEALAAYEQALNLYIQQGDRAQEALLRNNIGNVLASLGDYAQAETFYLEALQLAEEINDLPTQGQVLTDLGRLYDSLEDTQQSRVYYQRAVDEVFESTLANIQSSRLKSGFAAQHAHVYSRLVELLWDSGEYRLAFDYVERSRSRAFLDQIANDPILFRTTVEGELLVREQSLKAELTQLQDELERLTLVAADPGQMAALKDTLAQRQQDYLVLIERLKRQSPQAADLTAVAPASLGVIQGLLDSQTTLVEYFTLDDRVLAFVITQDTFHAQELSLDRATAAEAVQSFYEYDVATLASPHPAGLKQLQAALMAPLQSRLTTERLAIVPHGVLHYVPFAALTDGQQYLIDRHQLTLLPSANVLRFLETPSQNSGNPVIFGNPTFDLPFAGEEARDIAALYDVQPVIGKAATEEQLRSQANQASILHLATHGEYNANNPLFSQILFTDAVGGRDGIDNNGGGNSGGGDSDGRLQVHEIYELDLTTHTQLVVLSACQTQVGDASDGDEIIGLNRAFLFAGTPNVIATLWPISDQATALLMAEFYGFLQQGMSTAEALQQAQQQIRQDYAHPYYWAAFGLTGNGQ